MGSTFFGLEIAKSSIFTQQAALNTTGHNIANANTKGFSRQQVNMVTNRPMEAITMVRSGQPGQMGTGVQFDHIKRIREQFLDDQFRNENKFFGEWNVRKDTLDKIETVINEPSDNGLSSVMENFWNGWQELSKEPDNLTAREVVRERSLSLAESFNYTGKQLNDLTSDLTNGLGVKVTEINTFTSQIASLNSEIYRLEGLGNDANDLRDQRDIIMDDLSKDLNVTVKEDQSGFNIKIGNLDLVKGSEVSAKFTMDSLTQMYKNGEISSGEVKGLFYSRDNIVENYRTQLNAMVNTLANGEANVTLRSGTVIPEGTVLNGVTYKGTVTERTLANPLVVKVNGLNGLHELGFGLKQPLVSGIPLFETKPGFTELTATSIQVNSLIVDDVRNISSSSRTIDDGTGEKVIQGNGDLSILMSNMRSISFNFDPENSRKSILSDGTIEEFYRSVVGQFGVQSQEATRQADNQNVLVQQVDNRRSSVSGVSLDEEMANMIKYQHAYEAAARTLNAFDQMLDKVINNMGMVGR